MPATEAFSPLFLPEQLAPSLLSVPTKRPGLPARTVLKNTAWLAVRFLGLSWSSGLRLFWNLVENGSRCV